MIAELEAKAIDLRRLIIKLAYTSGCGYITSSFSALDLLIALYLRKILRYDSKNPDWQERDRFILSKAHASLALHPVLCEAGFITKDYLSTFLAKGSYIGNSLSIEVPGVDWHTGSLGHGLSAGVGYALSARIQKSDRLIYVMTGDGELDEGSNWEAAMSVAQFNLTNLVWIIDKNNIQHDGSVDDIMSLYPLDAKLQAFGFETKTIDGHNYSELLNALNIDRQELPKKPLAIIANTIKGKGLQLVENRLDWHGRKPTADELETIIAQIGLTREEFDAL